MNSEVRIIDLKNLAQEIDVQSIVLEDLQKRLPGQTVVGEVEKGLLSSNRVMLKFMKAVVEDQLR